MKPSKPLSQRGQRLPFDAVVIGTGLAGLTYALELTRLQPTARIALIAKKTITESNSYYAQGGMAAVSESYDSVDRHIKDTVKAGADLCNESVVEEVITQGNQAIRHLIDRGVAFNQQNGQFNLAQEGGHSARRIFHAGDQTGKAIIDALVREAKACPQITLLEDHSAIDLLTQTAKHAPGDLKEATGVYVLDENSGKIHLLLSNIIVLATGGAGKVFRYTSNPDTATGDGIAMAYRAGARVGNLEFYQFHPTLLYHPKVNNFLITEAMRGEGAHLIHPITHRRFMQDYAPEQMELATRDIVSRAIFTEIEKNDINCVYLDIRHQSREFLANRFPFIFQRLHSLGLDLSRDLIPVVPAAHYLCGGVLADLYGRTDIKRLYAIGETAFTGFHGANRLASNSLLEAAVMGKNAAEESAHWLSKKVRHLHPVHDWTSKHVTDLRRASQINAHWRSLRGEMTSYAGIVRTEAGLNDLLKLILTRRAMIDHYYRSHTITRDVIELRNIILVAKLIVNAAMKRTESRGGHYREDFPKQHRLNSDTLLRAKEVTFNFKGQ
jgi:L-aspartate oxidase